MRLLSFSRGIEELVIFLYQHSKLELTNWVYSSLYPGIHFTYEISKKGTMLQKCPAAGFHLYEECVYKHLSQASLTDTCGPSTETWP